MRFFRKWGSLIWSKSSERYYQVSIKQRVLLSFLVLIALSISAMGVLTYRIAGKEIQNNAFETSKETVDKTLQLLDYRLNDVAMSVQSLMLSDAYRQMMIDVQAHDVTKYYVHLSEMQYVLSQATFNEPMIENVLIATPIGDFYSTTQVRAQDNSFYGSELYDNSKKSPGGYWAKGHYDRLFTGSQRVVSFVVRGIYEQTPITNVFIVVNLRENRIASLLGQGTAGKDRKYLLLNKEGETVVQTGWTAQGGPPKEPEFLQDRTADSEGNFFYPFDGEDYLVNYKQSAVAPEWILAGMQSKDQLLGQLKGVQRTVLYVILVFLLTTWFFSNKLTAALLRPLFKLSRLMRRVEENQLSVSFESKYNDEIAQVGFQFNRMMTEIKTLIEDVRQKEKGKRHAEIRALTAQMEPHFLYNTLNTIYCKSVMGENEDVNEMILALSQMFQLGLGGGKDLITLEDELSHVQQYCAIQQKCYENLFVYRAETEEEELLSVPIPKILLQPIVENSIQHGFSDRRSGGWIHVRISLEQAMLHIVVEDNGKGMDTAKVELGMTERELSKKGYALVNIRHRLQLYYGDEARMELSGQAGVGSRTDLWIPLSLQKEEGGSYGIS
ncbi:two-component sensor histidine kinase [Paenibacillus helianthi]|uniref:Two-component sensor histidine kinase n=1 Tax=Paenibacillus helianthi TaxID=1349432 RepID=A0ABX3ESJ6_9BACL|nr:MULTISPECIES: histidine kinase [Paenibacillus]OKP87522.1 two-component sensor histidine kinase [Paenibacillus helianthi]OKP92573.1 two-component sensor histidine kinase [Paenibacillus sp. P3E]